MPGSMQCPLCGANSAYVGLNVVECREASCAAYTRREEVETLIRGDDWRATIARVRGHAARSTSTVARRR